MTRTVVARLDRAIQYSSGGRDGNREGAAYWIAGDDSVYFQSGRLSAATGIFAPARGPSLRLSISFR